MRYFVHVGAEQREIDLQPGYADGTWTVKMNGRTLPVTARASSDGSLVLSIDGQRTEAVGVRARNA